MHNTFCLLACCHLNFQFLPYFSIPHLCTVSFTWLLAVGLGLYFLRVYKTNIVMWFSWQKKHSCKARWMGCQFSLSWDLHLVTLMRTERTCHRGEETGPEMSLNGAPNLAEFLSYCQRNKICHNRLVSAEFITVKNDTVLSGQWWMFVR